MCRLLLVKAEREFSIGEQLQRFAFMAACSKEFQGHGWGCSYLENGAWQHYKNINPIWEDDLSGFGESRLLVAHARSAFKDEGIIIENNMPFHDDRYVFIFNGELRGVRIAEHGRIGAEKIFNFIKRFNHGNMHEALMRGTAIIRKRSKYIRAMNIIIAEKDRSYLASFFNEDPDYFTLHYSHISGKTILASDPLPGHEHWQKVPNETVQVIQ
ncbi:MAG: class II glutamine amidotransferase [Alphaproteobacteria bacterium]